MQIIGELALEIAMSVCDQNFEWLRSVLARASDYYELAAVERAICNAITPLTVEQQQWFNKAVYWIQSGGEPV